MTLLTLHASLMVIDTLFGYVVGNINAPNAVQYQPIVNNDQYSNMVILRGPRIHVQYQATSHQGLLVMYDHVRCKTASKYVQLK